jgi:hypothetical protein
MLAPSKMATKKPTTADAGIRYPIPDFILFDIIETLC